MKNDKNKCVTEGKECTMNYCDENGCIDRKRNLVEPSEPEGSGVVSNGIAMENHPGMKE